MDEKVGILTEEQRRNLEKVLRKHFDRNSEKHAWTIETIGLGCSAFLFGYQKKPDQMKEFTRHIRCALSLLENLPIEVRNSFFMALAFEFPASDHPDFSHDGRQSAELFVRKSLQKVMRTAEGFTAYAEKCGLPVAKEYRNWSVVGVTQICRLAWAAEKGCEAPKAAHLDRPGPFGNFLMEVFEAVGLTGDDGAPTSAHSALRSLNNVSKDNEET